MGFGPPGEELVKLPACIKNPDERLLDGWAAPSSFTMQELLLPYIWIMMPLGGVAPPNRSVTRPRTGPHA
jgi:hypothetical protein